MTITNGSKSQDEFNYFINNEETYETITEDMITGNGSTLIAWTDERETQYDILFTIAPGFFFSNSQMLQGGIDPTYLFVGIMRKGTFAFRVDKDELYGSYIAEKLAISSEYTADKLAELITGIKRKLT